MLVALVVLLFVAIHLASPRLNFLHSTPRSRWLSIGGGVSAAYVFAHLLPELAEHQATLADERQALIHAEIGVFLVALIGLVTFYGLERYAKSRARRTRAGGHEADPDFAPDRRAFALHVGSFTLYNVLIGYLLVHREEPDLRGLLLYALAMALHFLVNDRALDEHHGRLYRRYGRWLLAGAAVAGWAIGLLVELPAAAIAYLFAFLAGGVVMNVMKEELPEERESRFSAFVLGAGVYAGLILLTIGMAEETPEGEPFEDHSRSAPPPVHEPRTRT